MQKPPNKDRLDIWAKRNETWEWLCVDTTDPLNHCACLRSEVRMLSFLLSSICSGLSPYNLPLPQSQCNLTHCRVIILTHHQIVIRSTYNIKPKQWFPIPPTMKPKYQGCLPSETFSAPTVPRKPPLVLTTQDVASHRCLMINEQTCVGVSPCMVFSTIFIWPS